jgi:hypothetical protein
LSADQAHQEGSEHDVPRKQSEAEPGGLLVVPQTVPVMP